MNQKEDHVFFVKIKDPTEVRRSLLESLKDIVESLQGFEKFKAIREEKLGNIIKLRNDVKDLIKLSSSLKATLPETKLRIALEKAKKVKRRKHKAGEKTPNKPEKKAAKTGAKETKAEKPRPMTDLEKLESELSAIESRLASLK